MKDCWMQDYCPRPLYPYKTDQFCSRFALQWIFNGIQVCGQDLRVWTGSKAQWSFVRRPPTFVDVWYHGFWAKPSDCWNYRQWVGDGTGMLTGNPMSIITNKYMTFLTQSREMALLHNFYQSDPDREGSYGGCGFGKGTGWAPTGWGGDSPLNKKNWLSIFYIFGMDRSWSSQKCGASKSNVFSWAHSVAGFFSIYTSAEVAAYESEWTKVSMREHRQSFPLVFDHKLGQLPSQLGVFFSAKCSDDDPYIAVVKYSWGNFNPPNIEANEEQLILHMYPYMRLGGFWIPWSWSRGRFYAYDEGCFKVTAGVSKGYDSGWIDDDWRAHASPGWFVKDTSAMDALEKNEEGEFVTETGETVSDEDMKDSIKHGLLHGLEGIPKSMLVYFSPHQAGSGLQDKEAYPLINGYQPLLTGNPVSIMADHVGIKIENWKARWLRGVWRASCAHLDKKAEESEEWGKVREVCKPGWEFHFSGSWRVIAQGCATTKEYFGISQTDIFGCGPKGD